MVAYDGGFSPDNNMRNDKRAINDHIYSNLFDNVVKEKTAPLKESMNFFCSKAGYTVRESEETLSEELDKEITDMFTHDGLENSYDDIPDINRQEFDEIQDRIYAQTATMIDKLSMQKFFFKKQFVDGVNLSEAWNYRYMSLFANMSKYCKPDGIISAIREYNKWDDYLPSDDEIKKVKLSQELIDRAFDEIVFHSKISKTSSHIMLVKNILNTILGRNVIQSKTKDKKHYEHFISDRDREMYDLGMNYLRCFQVNGCSTDFIEEDNGLDYQA